jgi:hypothetical protein
VKATNQIRSLTPSTTWAVVDLRVSQVLSPACRMVSSPPLAAFTTLDFEARFGAVLRADRFFVERFLEEARVAELRFLPAVRLADFLVAAIWSSMNGGPAYKPAELSQPAECQSSKFPVGRAVAQITGCGMCHRHKDPIDLSLARYPGAARPFHGGFREHF